MLNMEDKPWHKNWPSDVPKHLNIPHFPLQAILSQTAKHFPDKTAITYNNQKITYAELEKLSDRFACALADLGVVQGERVAVFLPNVPQFVILVFWGA